jgi:thiosulfate/3-mercaptopyruvate sulfurtransferase
MLATAARFSEDARKLGINQHDTIIVYDRSGIYASPRLRLAFKAMGHDKVAVLDGGLQTWQTHGLHSPRHASSTKVSPWEILSPIFGPTSFATLNS